MLFVGSPRVPEGSLALWSADGTAAGFSRLTPPGVEVRSALVVLGTGTGSRAVFAASDAEHGIELWVTEGTPASTHLLVDLAPVRRPERSWTGFPSCAASSSSNDGTLRALDHRRHG